MFDRPIYLDYGATTPVDPRVAAVMIPFLTEQFGNPASSSHPYGRTADNAVRVARKHVAAMLKADPSEIIWTSGATEGNNLAIKGAAHFNRERGRHLITVATEHPAVLDTVAELERQGFEATVLRPGASGLIDPAQFRSALRPDTIVASVMMVNNEIGVIQPIEAIGAICRERGIVFHTDAVQAIGKMPIDVRRLPVDLLTLTAHKFYGPKGIGALYVRSDPRSRIVPQIHGGGHEGGLRSGTLPTHQIAGLGEAARIATYETVAEVARIRVLRDRLWSALKGIRGLHLNGDMQHRVAHNLNLSIEGTAGGSLFAALGEIAVSAGSACQSAHAAPSHVLVAIGRDDALASNAMRITLGRFTTDAEIDRAIALLQRELAEVARAG